jgi:hypothetical protein
VQTQSFAKAAYQSSAPGGFISAVVGSLKGMRDLKTATAKNKESVGERLGLRNVIYSTHNERTRDRQVYVPVRVEIKGGIGKVETAGGYEEQQKRKTPQHEMASRGKK